MKNASTQIIDSALAPFFPTSSIEGNNNVDHHHHHPRGSGQQNDKNSRQSKKKKNPGMGRQAASASVTID